MSAEEGPVCVYIPEMTVKAVDETVAAIVYSPARSKLSPVKLAMPDDTLTLVVPLKCPGPEALERVTVSAACATRLPSASSTDTLGWIGKRVPPVLFEGCTEKKSEEAVTYCWHAEAQHGLEAGQPLSGGLLLQKPQVQLQPHVDHWQLDPTPQLQVLLLPQQPFSSPARHEA